MKTLVRILAASLLFSACHQEELNTVPLIGSDCGSEGHRVSVTTDGDFQCLSASVIAIGSPEGDVAIQGLGLNGISVTLQIDSVANGDFPIGEDDNAVLWMQTGTAFLSTDEDPGVLTILSHDEATHRVSGTFDVVVHHAADPTTHELSGSFDVTYSPE